MTTPIHGTSSTQSLAQQIEVAERRILHRRRSLGIHGAGLARSIHDQIATPGLLWWGAGLGFLLGELTRDKVETSATSAQSLGRMIVTWMPLVRTLLSVNPPAPGVGGFHSVVVRG
jgi:hypothetical protein